MSYATINDKLRLMSCSISDMSQEVRKDYIEQFKDDHFENMSFFYLAGKDTIVLNKDHSDYEFYVFLVENYLEFDEEKRNILREQSPETIKDTIQSIDVVINHRMKVRA